MNAKVNDGTTALIQAAYNGHKEVVQALLNAKADVNAKNSIGKQPWKSQSSKTTKR